jgi:shikimate kinase
VTPARVLLIGMMGAGKTTVGREVASRLGWPLLDSDAEVARTTGMSVPQIFAHRGEAAFRAEESRVLAEAVTSDHPVVVSVAGGAVRDPDNRRRIRRAGLVVWLRADLGTLAARVGTGQGRPLLDGDPGTALRRLYAEREPLYRQLAHLAVDVDHLSPPEAADRVVSALWSGAALRAGAAGPATAPGGDAGGAAGWR